MSAPDWTILVVDAPGLRREGLVHLLQRVEDPPRVVVASDVAQAAREAADHQPRVALVDALLAEPGALAAVEAIAAASRATQLLLLSTTTHRAIARWVQRAGAALFDARRSFDELWALVLHVADGADAAGLDSPAAESPHARLTVRELEVLRLIAAGHSVKECAKILGRSTSTIDNHKARLMKKLNCHRLVELTRLAIREGLVPP